MIFNNFFNVEKTGVSFWDFISRKVVYEFKYKHNNKKFLSTSKYSFFRVNKDD